MNPYYVIFVCHAGRNRSPTAERVFKDMAEDAGHSVFGAGNVTNYDLAVLSAGVDADDDARQFESELVRPQDLVFALDPYIQGVLTNRYNIPQERIVTLDIKDVYVTNAPALEDILKEKLQPYLESLPKPKGR